MKRYVYAKVNVELLLDNGINPDLYDENQLRIISRGLHSGYDVSTYADPKFNSGQMEEIFYGLREGLDISQYADPNFDRHQMGLISLGLEEGIDVSQYADPKLSFHEMVKIYNNLSHKSTKMNWQSVIEDLKAETDDGIDSIYHETNAGSYILDTCIEVEDKLGMYVEPSVQAGMGNVTIFVNNSAVGQYDYEDFNDEIIDLAISSKSKADFKKKYSKFLHSILA